MSEKDAENINQQNTVDGKVLGIWQEMLPELLLHLLKQ